MSQQNLWEIILNVKMGAVESWKVFSPFSIFLVITHFIFYLQKLFDNDFIHPSKKSSVFGLYIIYYVVTFLFPINQHPFLPY